MITRREQAKIMRQNILEAADALIKEHGYDSVRVIDIAEACNMSVGNFYNYFNSLEDLFDEIENVMFYKIIERFQANMNGSLISRLNAFIKGWIETMINKYGHNYSYYWSCRHVRRPSNLKDDRFEIIMKPIMEHMEFSLEQGELNKDTPIDSIVTSIAYSIFSCTAHYGIHGDGEMVLNWMNDYCKIYIEDALKPYLND